MYWKICGLSNQFSTSGDEMKLLLWNWCVKLFPYVKSHLACKLERKKKRKEKRETDLRTVVLLDSFYDCPLWLSLMENYCCVFTGPFSADCGYTCIWPQFFCPWKSEAEYDLVLTKLSSPLPSPSQGLSILFVCGQSLPEASQLTWAKTGRDGAQK